MTSAVFPVTPRRDVVTLPLCPTFTLTMSNSTKNPYNARVVGREEVNPQLLILRVQPEAAPV